MFLSLSYKIPLKSLWRYNHLMSILIFLDILLNDPFHTNFKENLLHVLDVLYGFTIKWTKNRNLSCYKKMLHNLTIIDF